MAEIIRIDVNSWRIEDGFVRCFVLAGREKALLIDTGMTLPNARELAESITDLPLELLNTHADPDHISGNQAFGRMLMHPAEEENYRFHGGAGEISLINDGALIELGERQLEVIHIPGHTAGSIALLDPKARVLISGDSVQTDNIFMFGPRRNIGAFIESMERLEGMKDRFDLIWPSHGSFPAGPELIAKLIEGARSIVSGRAEGTVTEHRGSKVMLYRFPYAGFICDMRLE